MNKLVEELMKAQKDYTNRNSVINYLIKEKKQKETALNNILKAIEQGIMNNTTNKRMQELENQIEDLQRKILVERSKLSIIVPEQEIRRYYSQALEQEPAMLINYLIKEIKMFNDTMEITFNSPINKSPDSQGFSFYTEKCKIKNIQNKNFATYQEIEIKMFI